MVISLWPRFLAQPVVRYCYYVENDLELLNLINTELCLVQSIHSLACTRIQRGVPTPSVDTPL